MFKKKIDQIIKIKQPITIEKFIELCLYSDDGYYSKKKILGKKGDFITSPEISQLFGELIGFFILSVWKKKINKPFNLVELGPGRGTLLIDILNITQSYLKFNKAMNIYLIEKNTELIKEQKNNLKKFHIKLKNINWHNEFKIPKNKPTIIYANEFFDCLPIRQFYKKSNQWYEKMIIFNKKENFLQFKDIKIKDINILNKIHKYEPIETLEISEAREKYFKKICEHISNVGGVAIIIDYGYFDKPKHFTLQSLFNNKKSNVLDNLGQQDITSLVDFKKLIDLTKYKNLNIDIFCTQREFFLKYGIYQRAQKIIKKLSYEEKNIIKEGLNRLIDANNMGSLFKVLVISN